MGLGGYDARAVTAIVERSADHGGHLANIYTIQARGGLISSQRFPKPTVT